ncbi:hypothetical protein N9U60_02125 [Betaproteobacteria bacterium]|nr:hypothetical protein [Betaproteobacteria bacterium]
MKTITIAVIKISFKLFGTLPLPFLRMLGKAFGFLMWGFSKKYRKHFQNNWLQAKKADEKGKMDNCSLLKAVGNSGEIFIETTKIWTRADILSLVETEGIDLIEETVKHGKGLICLTPHLGSFELAPRVVSELTPLTVMYRPPKREDLDELLVYFRDFQNVNMVKTNYTGVKSLIKFLQSGNCVGILPDQVPDRGAGKWTPFFTKLAYTNTLVIRLAKLTSAPIAWIICVKSSKGWKFSAEIWSYRFDKKTDENESLIELNRKIEQLIYEHPEQYLWGYDRFKMPK